jgi:hypothetical protein
MGRKRLTPEEQEIRRAMQNAKKRALSAKKREEKRLAEEEVMIRRAEDLRRGIRIPGRPAKPDRPQIRNRYKAIGMDDSKREDARRHMLSRRNEQARQMNLLQKIIDDEGAAVSSRLVAIAEYRAQKEVGRREKERGQKEALLEPQIAKLTEAELVELRSRVWRGLAGESGYLHEWYMEDRKRHDLDDFIREFRYLCEKQLYVFAKFILGMRDLTGYLHRPVCEWVQDMRSTRRKLLMLPVVHLKTSIGSQAFPLFVLIQPYGGEGLFFPEMKGTDCRVLLNGESEAKAGENLSYIQQHLENNRILRAMWPTLMWADKNQARDWTSSSITLPRGKIVGESTITAIGVGTNLHGRHYDVIIADDLATMKAAQSELVMEKAKFHRKALRSRLDSLEYSIELGIGTHWTPNDIYVEWRRDPSVLTMIRGAIEGGKPLWPERHSLKQLLALQAEEGMGKVLFSANYMNNPLNTAFTALDWEETRGYWIEGDNIVARLDARDEFLEASTSLSQLERVSHLHGESLRGVRLDHIYKDGRRFSEEELAEIDMRRAIRFQRKLQTAEEGSPGGFPAERELRAAVAAGRQLRERSRLAIGHITS